MSPTPKYALAMQNVTMNNLDVFSTELCMLKIPLKDIWKTTDWY